MDPTAPLISQATATTAGIVLLTVVAIAYGGTFLLRVVRGQAPANDLQQAFFRAGHAHAGVLVILGLVVTLYVDLAGVSGTAAALSRLVLLAAILMPAGFFLSVTGRDPQRPNRLIALVWVGAASLAAGVVAAGVGLLTL
jgi:cytochrome b561